MNRTQPQRLISKAELCRRVTCTRAYVYRQCKDDGHLFEALVGDKVDLNHPAAYAFCVAQGYSEPDGAAIAAQVRHTKKTRPAPAVPAPPPAAEFEDEDLDPDGLPVSEILEMPLGEVIRRFGTATRLHEYVKVVKDLTYTRGQEEEQARKRKDYIHRTHVEQLVTHIDALQKALLTDTVRNITTRTQTQVAAGAERAEIENSMRDVISRTIKAVKSETQRRLRDV